MSEKNADSLKDLPHEKQMQLCAYIAKTFKSTQHINKKFRAYGLKQRYTNLYIDKEWHVTSKCFMEAMVYAGFTAEPVSDEEPNWYFNIAKPNYKD